MNPLWTELAAAADTPLSISQLDQLDQYLTLLTEKNQFLNLTRIVDRADAEIKHVADALTLLPFIPKAAGRRSLVTIGDIGTGGGIPGAILAIARPDAIVTLIDATKKKLDAVQGICREMGLRNVHVLHSRADEVKLVFDVVTVRAVGELQPVIEWCHALLKPGSVLLAMKGPKAAAELEAAVRTLRKRRFSSEIIEVSQPALPGHVIVKLTKRL